MSLVDRQKTKVESLQAHSDPSQTFTVRAATSIAAMAAPTVAARTGPERAIWLHTVAEALDAQDERLATLADGETALGMGRLMSEIGRTTGQLRMFADVLVEGGYLDVVIDHADPKATPPRPDLRRMMRPLGPIAVFAAGNFPFAFSVAGGDMASALAAGCPVVLKAHPGYPHTSRATAEVVGAALSDVAAPAGTFGMVEGFGAGAELVTDPKIKAVGFTGSLAGGRALFDLATSRPEPIPFYGELGSLNPVVLTRGAVEQHADELAAGLADSFTLGVGQFCTKPGVAFIPEGAGFEAALAQSVNAADSKTMLHDSTATRFSAAISELMGGSDLEVVIGDAENSVTGRDARPIVLATSVRALLGATDQLLQECFGPSILLVRYASQDELLSALDAFPGALTATVHAESHEHEIVAPIVAAMNRFSGRLIYGGWPTGVTVGWAQHHGGPWPATTAPLHTSVGAAAIRRFLSPVAYQDVPEILLPTALAESNPLSLPRRVDGKTELP